MSTVFPVAEFNYFTALTATTMAEFNILIINLDSNLNHNFTKDFFKFIIQNWSGYTHRLNVFSPRILGIWPVLPLHVYEAIVEVVINVLVIDSSCWKLSHITLDWQWFNFTLYILLCILYFFFVLDTFLIFDFNIALCKFAVQFSLTK